MRRWRGLKLRRGAYYSAPPSSPVPPPYAVPFIRRVGQLRFGARLLPSRRRRFDPPWPQANQGQAWPSWIRQPRTPDRRGLRLLLSRGRRFDPPWFPPTPPAPAPQFLRPAGPLRFGARLLPSARRTWGPPWPQANQGQAWPSWIQQAGTRARFTRAPRGRRFDPPWVPPSSPPPPQLIRPAGSLRFAARLLPSGRRRADPPWPQGPLSQAWPSWIRQPRTPDRRGLRLLLSRGRRFDPPWFPPPVIPPPQWLRQDGPLRTPARLLPAARRRFDPPWPQGNQGQAWPSWIRQPRTPDRRGLKLIASHGRRFDPPWYPQLPPPPQLLRPAGPLRVPARLLLSRGRRYEPAWPQANRGQPWPVFTVQAGIRGHLRAAARRGRYMEPPWPQVTPPPATANGAAFLVFFP